MVKELVLNQIDCFECEYWHDNKEWTGKCTNILSPSSGTQTPLQYVCGFGVKQKPKPPELPPFIIEQCNDAARESKTGSGRKHSTEEIQCLFYILKGNWKKIHYCMRECPKQQDIVTFAQVVVRK